MKRKSPRRQLALVALAALIVAASAYALTAANAVPATTAGDGTGAITGYAVTSVAYVLATADPSTIDKVTFTVNPITTGQVKAKVVAASTTYTTCTNTAGAVSCDFVPDVSVASADQLRVIATS